MEILDDYVSFDMAKLLKEKGFNEKCQKVYLYDGTLVDACVTMIEKLHNEKLL